MNPEFRRNVLLELSMHRLLAMPVLLLMVFAAADLIGGPGTVVWSAKIAMIGLLVFWGSRLSADSILGEVAARTWDGQRMSALGPWAIGVGKLAGSTIYAWYGAAVCVAGFLYDWGKPLTPLVDILLLGLFVQAVGLFASLVFLRLRPQRTQFQVTQAQFAALAAGALYWNILTQEFPIETWYGLFVDRENFMLVSAAAFLGWCWIGIYRLLRAELQFRGYPVGWTAFVLFCAVYAGGFPAWPEFGAIDVGAIDVSGVEGADLLLWLRAAFLVAAGLTWGAAFAEPKGFVGLRRWGSFIRAGHIRRALEAMPAWLPGGFATVLLGLTLAALWWSSPDLRYVFDRQVTMNALGPFVLAVMLFLLRDIGLMHLFTLDGRARRGHFTALVYLAVLYVVLPAFFVATGWPDLALALVPQLAGDPLMIVLPVLMQVALVGGLVVLRWRRIAQNMAGVA